MRVTWVGVLAFGLALGGCLGDPATEAPLTMADGLYEVELPGAAIAGFDVDGEREATKKLCLRPGDGDFFAHRVIRETMILEGCGDPVNERTGNALRTTISCPIEPGRGASGEAVLRGRGHIRETSFSANFKVDLSKVETKDEGAREASRMLAVAQTVGSVTVKARRIGDCPA